MDSYSEKMDSFKDVWELVADYCHSKVSDMVYKLWIARIKPVSFNGNTAILFVQDQYPMQLIKEKYIDLISEGFHNVFGFDVEIIITDNPEYADVSTEKNKEEISSTENEPDVFFNDSDYTFDSFIVGPSNNFAHAAAMAVANNPAKVYNPLFIYGDSGLGKTHLMMAISNHIRKTHPEFNLVYAKGEEFANEIIMAIREGTTPQFRNNYRQADVLLIDDIQFIGGKESTQEEFFHTFEALHTAGKQIVITSDRPPKEIKTLEDRLRSRFESGLLADIQPPNFETRIAIIHRKAEELGLSLPDNVTEYIANRIKSNIRQLEGAVKKINAYRMLGGINPTIAVATQAIKDILTDSQPVTVTVEKIINEVARTFNVTPEDIKSKKKSATISNARQIAAYIIRKETSLTVKQVGEELGGRHYSTIVYSENEVKKMLEDNQSLQNTIDDIVKNVKK